jgi:chemotaxis protein CheD
MIEYTLNIGDVVTSLQPANYTCFGLGSCIGLFLQDRVTGISGGAHIFLPESEGGLEDGSKFYSASTAIEEILNQFKVRGSTLDTLRAKIVGGSNVIGVNTQMGSRIAQSVVNHLVENKIFIAAIDVGGNFCRTAKFNGGTGQLEVCMPAYKECKTY